jgi:hypothetical protein
MKAILLLIPFALAACTSTKVAEYRPPETELIIDKQVHPMTRNEVITAINECEANRTRAVIINGRRKVNGFTTEIVVDVTCAPQNHVLKAYYDKVNERN